MLSKGQKIVCIDDKFRNVTNDQIIREGEVYTVRWAGIHSHYIDGDYNGVLLEEIVRGDDPAGYCEGDLPYKAGRFKPVVTPKIKKEKRITEEV